MKEYRIFGPPGTGKTWSLAWNVLKAAKKYSPDDIVVCSYTKTAAREIASRVRWFAKEQDLEVKGIKVGTLHSICYNLLGGKDGGVKIAEQYAAEWNKENPMWPIEGISGGPEEDGVVLDEVKSTVYTRVNHYRNRMIPIELWDLEARAFYQKWEDWKRSNDLIDFTDMLEICYNERVKPDFKVGFFDEAQDFSKLSSSLVRMWGQDMDYFILAGDDDQVLYGWAGASADVMLYPKLEPDRIRILKESHRLPSAVKDYADRWIHQIPPQNRQEKEFLAREYVGSVSRLNASYRRPQAIIDLIEKNSGTHLILASCSYMLKPIIQLLRERGIVFHNPYRPKNGAWNPLPYKTVERFLYFVEGYNKSQWRYKYLIEWFQDLRASFFQGTKKFAMETAKHFSKTCDDNKWGPLNTVLSPEFLAMATPEDFYEYVYTKKRYLYEFVCKMYQRIGPERLKRPQPNVIVGTIHSLKGGEADHVYIFPDLSKMGYKQYLKNADDTIRQFYVGITRAKKSVYLCMPSSRMAVKWLTTG